MGWNKAAEAVFLRIGPGYCKSFFLALVDGNVPWRRADLVLFGHIHMRMDRNTDGIRLFNPGSAAQPRDQFGPSFGLVDVLEAGLLTSHGELARTPSPFEDMFGW